MASEGDTSAPPPNMNANDSSAPNNSNIKNIKLLLHGENGTFPLLTPYLLRTYFSPKSDIVKNHLILGVAVKDSFVVPVFPIDPNAQGQEGEGIDGSNKRKLDEIGKNEDDKESEKKARLEQAGKDNDNNTTGSAPAVTPKPKENKNGNNKKKKQRKIDTKKPIGFTYQPKSITHHLRIPPLYNIIITPTFDPLQDLISTKTLPTYFSATPKVNNVALCTPNGQQKINPQLYHKVVTDSCDGRTVDAVALFDSALSDHLVKEEEKEKSHSSQALQQKVERDVQRTSTFLNSILEEGKNEMNGGGSHRLWGAIVGGSDEKQRVVSAKVIGQHSNKLHGAVVVGWHHITSRQKRLDILQCCQTELMQNTTSTNNDVTKNVAILETLDFLQIIDAAIKSGISVIGTSLPLKLALSKRAIILNFHDWRMADKEGTSDKGRETKTNEGPSPCEGIYMDLFDTKYAHDFSPILENCSCIACGSGNGSKQHSRAYIHHLINANELLAKILLFGHNLHVMLHFFQKMSAALSEGEGESFFSHVEKQICSAPEDKKQG